MIVSHTSELLVLIEGVLFNVRYLGSTHSDCEGRSEKEDRIHQAEMAVHEVKVSLTVAVLRLICINVEQHSLIKQ